jgi:hypothetical protein
MSRFYIWNECTGTYPELHEGDVESEVVSEYADALGLDLDETIFSVDEKLVSKFILKAKAIKKPASVTRQ